MMNWRPDGLLKAVLFYIALGMIPIWLPLNRGLMDGNTYEWGLFNAGGTGIGGDYWMLPLLFLFGGGVLYLGWRGARRPFHWLMLIWLLFGVAQSAVLTLLSPEEVVFQGDTLGTAFPIGPVLFAADLLFLALGALWVWRDRRSHARRSVPRWSNANRRLLALFVGLIPVQFVLLRLGEPHGTTDEIGVLLTIGQLLLLNVACYPWGARRRY